jgi:hypothetical protein
MRQASLTLEAERKAAVHLHQDERRRGEEFGRYGYLAYADPALHLPAIRRLCLTPTRLLTTSSPALMTGWSRPAAVTSGRRGSAG